MLELFTWIIAALSVVPLLMALWNRLAFRRLSDAVEDSTRPEVSVLIPARDEEASIVAAMRSVLASRGVKIELIVLDDGSTDRTADLVVAAAESDSRVRLVRSQPLPAGWCGKQFACHQLSKEARYGVLMWMDADVRLRPDAAARMVDALRSRDLDLLSGFPRQVTGSFGEQLLIPLIHLLLVCYLPIGIGRLSRRPAFSAGCGQLFMARRDAYEHVGGHAAIRASMHDGLTLPRAFRKARRRTDVFDAGDIAGCRMYSTTSQTVEGLAKNATEGLATPVGIWVWTVLLLGGHVLPFAFGAWCLATLALGGTAFSRSAMIGALASCGMAALTSLFVGRWFRQPWIGTVLRPFAVSWLLAIQWRAWARRRMGRPVDWRRRGYPLATKPGEHPEPAAQTARPSPSSFRAEAAPAMRAGAEVEARSS